MTRQEAKRIAYYKLDCPPQDNPLTDIAVEALAGEILRADFRLKLAAQLATKVPDNAGCDRCGTNDRLSLRLVANDTSAPVLSRNDAILDMEHAGVFHDGGW